MAQIMTTREMAEYLRLHEITICKHAADGKIPAFRIKFKISNPEDTDGIITINIDLYDPNDQSNSSDDPPDFTKKIYLPAHSAKEIGFVFATEPVRMNIFTHISLNLPDPGNYSPR